MTVMDSTVFCSRCSNGSNLLCAVQFLLWRIEWATRTKAHGMSDLGSIGQWFLQAADPWNHICTYLYKDSTQFRIRAFLPLHNGRRNEASHGAYSSHFDRQISPSLFLSIHSSMAGAFCLSYLLTVFLAPPANVLFGLSHILRGPDDWYVLFLLASEECQKEHNVVRKVTQGLQSQLHQPMYEEKA